MKSDIKYRPEIDGLRAIAVVPVILFHAGFEMFSGGFVGVDVFFVISGYLITGIIHGEIENGSFSIVRFYERRIRRILPALFVVSLVCIPFAWAWMLTDEFVDFSQSLIAVNLFVSNILFWQESGYFDAAAELKPLLHTWSLAVEEQFYVFFPLLLLLLRNADKRTLTAILAASCLLSLGLADWASTRHPTANFYLLPTRAWELGIGALLAVGVQAWVYRDGWVAEIGSILGIGMVVFAVFFLDGTVPFPGLWALIPVLGTALVIVFARTGTLTSKMLSWRPVVFLGLISYSAYLWHQPLFAFARIRLIDGVPPWIHLLLIVVTFALAYLSWRFVEQPFRNTGQFARGYIFSRSAGVSAAVIVLGAAGYVFSGFPNLPGRDGADGMELARAAEPLDHENSGKGCHPNGYDFIRPESSCTYGADLQIDVALWGDSHGKALAKPAAQFFNDEQHGLRQLTYNGCAPTLGYYRSDRGTDCATYNAEVMSFLLTERDLRVVILVARWTFYIEGVPFDNAEGGIERDGPIYALPLDRGLDFISDSNRVNEIGELYRASVQTLLDNGKRVVLVYPVPEAGWDVSRRLAREAMLDTKRQEALSTSYDVFVRRTANTHAQLDKIPDHPNLIRIRPEEIFCDTFVAKRCVTEWNGAPLYFDDDHLNSKGSAMLAEKITDAMKEKGWL